MRGRLNLDLRPTVCLLGHLRPLYTDLDLPEQRRQLGDLVFAQPRVRVEQVGCGLSFPVVQVVEERLGGPRRAAVAAAKQHEPADGDHGDPGPADTEHLPAVQPGDHLVVPWLAVLSLSGLALLSWRLALWLTLPGLTLTRLATLWLALTPALLWLSTTSLPALWPALPGLALLSVTTLAGVPLALLASEIVTEREPTRVTHGCPHFDGRSTVRTLCHTMIF